MKPYYQDALVTLYHADAREFISELPPMEGASIVMDPPYGINFHPPRKKTKSIKNDTLRLAKSLLYAVVPGLFNLVPDGSAHLVFSSWSSWWLPELLEQWFTLKGLIVWDKKVFGIGYYVRPQHELIWYLHKGKPLVPKIAPADVWQVRRELSPEHSCQKPVQLLSRCLQFLNCAVVIDPFAGTGSTLRAAKDLGIKAVGCELEEEYCELIARNLAQEILPMFGATEQSYCDNDLFLSADLLIGE